MPRGLFKYFSAFGNHGLSKIHGRHVALETAKPRFDCAHYFIAALAVWRCSKSATVSRVRSSSVGPSPPLEITSETRFSASRNASASKFAIVANDGLAQHFDAELVQLFGEKQRVGVQAVRRKQAPNQLQ